MASVRSSPDSNAAGVPVLDRFDFLLATRLEGKPRVLGSLFLGVLFVSLILSLTIGGGHSTRVLFFPADRGSRLVAEERFLPHHRSLEAEVREVVDGVLLGPMSHNSERVFPRGAVVRSAIVRGHTLYLDLSSRAIAEDPEVPLKGRKAFEALARSIRHNFPRLREIAFFIDGQLPRFGEEKNI